MWGSILVGRRQYIRLDSGPSRQNWRAPPLLYPETALCEIIQSEDDDKIQAYLCEIQMFCAIFCKHPYIVLMIENLKSDVYLWTRCMLASSWRMFSPFTTLSSQTKIVAIIIKYTRWFLVRCCENFLKVGCWFFHGNRKAVNKNHCLIMNHSLDSTHTSSMRKQGNRSNMGETGFIHMVCIRKHTLVLY
jgi:hypothetical protein